MADKNSDLDFSDNADDFDNFSDDSASITDDSSPKKDPSARRRLDELLEEKRLSKMLKDEFDDW